MQEQENGLRYVVTARSPPHPRFVKQWLKDLQEAHEAGRTHNKVLPANFGMDPNTGKLLVRDSASQDSGGSAKESDLLGTPAFASPPIGPASTRLRGRSRLGLSSQAYSTHLETEVAICHVFAL